MEARSDFSKSLYSIITEGNILYGLLQFSMHFSGQNKELTGAAAIKREETR